jgi:3-oxoadipate enol-lactonase/4-carboxymuconolactone decarboxylase
LSFATIDGVRHFYRVDGNDDRPTILFSHSLGCDHAQWDSQAADLLPYFRVLRYDIRGHGASDVTPGEYSIEQLGRDALAVADAAGIGTFAFCGLSLGGMIGQWLGANAGDRLTHLVLANTSPHYPNPQPMEDRRTAVLRNGMLVVVEMVLQRFFTPEFIAKKSPELASTRRTFLSTNPVGYGGCCAAIRDMNNIPSLGKIRTPTLIVFGDRDLSTPWTGAGEILAASIPGAIAVGLPSAHLSNLELPRTFTSVLLDFLQPPAGNAFEAGDAMRREVLGHAHVDRSTAGATEFNREFQQLITRYAWGAVWTRPLLDRRTRRMLVIATTAAMGRWEEFRLHTRAALADGLEPCDLKELLLQTAVYAGVPAANTGFQVAMEELQSLKEKKSK